MYEEYFTYESNSFLASTDSFLFASASWFASASLIILSMSFSLYHSILWVRLVGIRVRFFVEGYTSCARHAR